MHRYPLLVWVPTGVRLTDELALLLVQRSEEARKYPPMDDPCIEVRPVEVHEDSAGFVHPGVDGRDYYMLEYAVDLRAMQERALCQRS